MFIGRVENFQQAFETKFYLEKRVKTRVKSELSNPFRDSIFSKSMSFLISLHIFGLVRRMILNCLRAQRAGRDGPSRYLEHDHRTRRKFSTIIQNKVVPRKTCQNQSQVRTFQPVSRTNFFKIHEFFHFLAYLRIGVSYDPDCFYERKELV